MSPKENRISARPAWKAGARAGWWCLIGYLAAVSPLVFIAASAWVDPHAEWRKTPDWKPVFARAEGSWASGDLYDARHRYLQAARMAGWTEDWEGLIAAACGLRRVDGAPGPYSSTHTILVRAMIAAETRRSRAGISAVAKAFETIGKHNAAAMVLARVGKDWPEETEEPAGKVAGCREHARGKD
jgi:hypothetical protein